MKTNSENQLTRFDIIEKCFYTNNFGYYVTAQTVTTLNQPALDVCL